MMVKDELILRNYKVSGMPRDPEPSKLRIVVGDHIMSVWGYRAVGAGLRKEYP
jgi:hypothetical protein